MTQPVARVLALLELLQAGGLRTVPDLAARLAVDERTVRRYARHLDDLGIPVESVRGRYGGYRLAAGFRLPPLMFTDDEAVAVALALARVEHDGTVDGPMLAARTAAAKLQRSLPPGLRQRVDRLLAVTRFSGTTRDHRASDDVDTEILLTLAAAVDGRHPVAVTHARRPGTVRVVHPFGLVTHATHWYLAAIDPGLGEPRTFRVDRIRSAVAEPGTVPRPDLDPEDVVLAGLASAPHRHDVVLRARGTPADVARVLPRSIADVSPDTAAPGWCRVSMRIEHLDRLAAELAGLDLEFAVAKPRELRAELRRRAAALRRAAG